MTTEAERARRAEYQRRWVAKPENAQKFRAYHKKWRDANPEKVRAAALKTQAKNAQKILDRKREAYRQHRIRMATDPEYADKFRTSQRAYQSERRQRRAESRPKRILLTAEVKLERKRRHAREYQREKRAADPEGYKARRREEYERRKQRAADPRQWMKEEVAKLNATTAGDKASTAWR